LWGEERIANELQVKLGIEVSPRTVRKYLPSGPRGRPRGDLRWSTFLRTHAQGMLACDFFVTVTASFRLLYVFVVIEHGSRRLLHLNVTGHPSAAWTLQQLREAVGLESRHRFLLHDRDSIFSAELDRSISALGITVLKSAPRTPRMNAVCERVIGTIRRECLDWVIPLSEAHLRTVLRSWVKHYNRGRPHMGLGPGIPDAPLTLIAKSTSRHRRGHSYVVRANPILGGLHHEHIGARVTPSPALTPIFADHRRHSSSWVGLGVLSLPKVTVSLRLRRIGTHKPLISKLSSVAISSTR
jgi:putative transposase